MKYDLSILIPARNEMFTARTVQDIIEKKRGKTEIIVGMDGQWSNPGLEDHPDVRILYLSQPIGQRAMTNRLCRLSKAKYVMKIDAHCAFDEGFDVKLMADMQGDWTVVPIMKNLHAFDWVCSDGHRRYQGPSGPCQECGKQTTRDILWRAKPSPNSTSYRFDKTLKFQYFGEYKAKQEGDLVETMSLQGSCFMLTRDKYWELNICDEQAGSWGHQGTEVAIKTWLSGGRVIVNKKTWYAHMFRTQGGDFGFPWPAHESQIEKTRQHFRDTFLEDKWPLAKRKLQWLTDKFDAPDWHDTNRGIIYYTDNQLMLKIAHKVQKQLLKISREKNIPIVSASLKPMSKMGKNIVVKGQRGHLTMFRQILAALEASDTEIIFFCEHDVLYHPSHFDFRPSKRDAFYYNTNVWKVRYEDGHALWVNNCRQVSGICVYKETAIKHYQERIAHVEKKGRFERNMGFEPGTHGRIEWQNKYASESWLSQYPNIDIRHEKNLTPNRWSPNEFRNKKNTEGWKETTVDKIPGWDNLEQVINSFK
ncbi:glycosyltransferase [Candidatus Saccharibacteria bacterium]|nr:glycosyltransferase [Candidatus Saccharibacteria bacterium]